MNSPEPSADVAVTRLRISHVAARICDGLEEIGQPVAFATRLSSLTPVRGLPITLPFAADLRVDTDFWSRIAQRRLSTPVDASVAPKLRRAGVPLRARGELAVRPPAGGTAAVEVPRLELHLHPFGVVALTTVDLHWAQPASLAAAQKEVQDLEQADADVSVGDASTTTTLSNAAEHAADDVVTRLASAGASTWPVPRHRVITIVEGAAALAAMPAANSALHLALHHLSDGDAVVAPPATAFVAQWSGAGYAWPPNNLVYVLDRGAAVLPSAVGGPRSADRHRHLQLMTAHVTALAGLVRAAPQSSSGLFEEWAKTAAQHLGRLFGPGSDYLDWGLIPRALLQRAGASADVDRVLGTPLTTNPDYPVPDFP